MCERSPQKLLTGIFESESEFEINFRVNHVKYHINDWTEPYVHVRESMCLLPHGYGGKYRLMHILATHKHTN